ncbi:hypothetical protein ABH992_006972 [Bradyrhizobium yuanmingense]|uniref:Uncharacterized protein n=1 Tax=Bradyrhizobium yuanmingense TaxID=108015 RepID=A0ABV4GRK1_9BRAD
MRWSPGVFAMRSGIMKATGLTGLPSASMTSPDGSFSVSTKVFASTGSSEAVIAKMRRPSALRVPQRRSEATQSADVTGWPSCHFRPSRSVNV